MPTSALALPLVNLIVETGTNEDWVDSIKYVVDDGGGVVEDYPQLDLAGITFAMEVRRTVPDHEVVIRATTENGQLSIGEPPDYGFLLIHIDHEIMQRITPDKYLGDIIASDAEHVRRCATIDLTVILGITRP